MQVIKLSYPLFISGLFASAMGLVDTAIVGHLATVEAISGVGVGAAVISLLSFLGFLRYSVSGTVGQWYASQQYSALKTLLLRCVLLSLCVGFLSAVLTFVVAPIVVKFMNVSGLTASEAVVYMHTRVWEFPFAMFNYFMLGWFVGCANTVSAMRSSMLMIVLNVGFSYVYAIVLGWGVFGVALGTVQATICVSVYNIWVVCIIYKPVIIASISDKILSWTNGLQYIVISGLRIAIRNIFLSASLVIFMGSLAVYGTVVLAASAILIQILQMTSDTLDSVADAGSGLIAKSIGSGYPPLSHVIHATTVVAVISSILFGGLVYVMSPLVFTVLTDKPSVIVALHDMRFWLWICPIIIIWAFLYDGYFIGASLTTEMRNSIIIAFLVYGGSVYSIKKLPIFNSVDDALFVFFVVFYMARFLPLYIWRGRIDRLVNT